MMVEDRLKPWVIDATDMQDSSEVDTFGRSLMLSTHLTTQYLDDSNTSKLIVVATKGFGKTLLLQAKRRSLEVARKKTLGNIAHTRKRSC
jgi:hypothetical protein